MCFGCSKEPSHRDGSFEYPQHMFWMRNKENSFSMRIVGVIFHGIDIAKEMKLRHFRGNVELPRISVDRKYDSFYQVARMLENPVLVEKVSFCLM